jgi:hypothetical protein
VLEDRQQRLRVHGTLQPAKEARTVRILREQSHAKERANWRTSRSMRTLPGGLQPRVFATSEEEITTDTAMTKKPQLITRLGRSRMLQMIDYLYKLPPAEFDFSIVAESSSCGTVGCIIGHTPNVFPEICEWTEDPSVMTDDGTIGYCVNGEDFGETAIRVFELQQSHDGKLMEDDVASMLFSPGKQTKGLGSGIRLNFCGMKSQPHECAEMLESFLAQVDDIDGDSEKED